ncbi:hypothetical protein CR513_24743, partial [Mucuna pruriens]
MLHGTKSQYQMIEKQVLTFIALARRLHPYFHSMPELAGKMTTWSVELSKFVLKFELRGAIKT